MRRRRALVYARREVGEELERRLSEAGYATRAALPTAFSQASDIEDFAPDLALFEVGAAESEAVTLARRLRAEPSTYALPIVFLFHRDERTLRNAALTLGADDYFALETPAAVMQARLDALFWRAEVGRRAATIVGEQHAEIDNFLLLLDTVRADAEANVEGTLALILAEPQQASSPRSERERLLQEVHGFLKLNLRRIDTVAFYGPTMLLAYLPRTTSAAGVSTLRRLGEEFLERHRAGEILGGLASFPADGKDVEELVGKAEEAVAEARQATGGAARVLAYRPDAKHASEPKHASEAKNAAETKHAAEAKNILEAKNAAETGARVVPRRAIVEAPTAEAKLPSQRASEAKLPSQRASEAKHVVRESKSFDALHAPASTGLHGDGSALARAATEAAARELERRARGEVMPRRLLLTVSDPARMAQVNLLIRAAGYEVRAAFDGQQALNLLRIERPDLLLLDYDLHGLDGMETLRRLRRQSGGRLKLPVVLLVPAGRGEVRGEALNEGVRGIVELPFDPAKLLDVVRTAGLAE